MLCGELLHVPLARGGLATAAIPGQDDTRHLIFAALIRRVPLVMGLGKAKNPRQEHSQKGTSGILSFRATRQYTATNQTRFIVQNVRYLSIYNNYS